VTQPRRPDEVALFKRLRQQTGGAPYKGVGSTNMIALWEEIGIPRNRGEYLLGKWVGKGWWGYGTWAKGGWFTPEAPEDLK
jgi:beta-galactosidase GanA